MSKSYGNTIDIFAEGKALQKQVMGIVTDATPVDQPKYPEGNNVFALYKLFATPDELGRLADLYRNPMLDADARKGRPFGYGDAKKMLLDRIDAYFAPAREKRKALAADPASVEGVLADGARRARVETCKTMELVRWAVGLHPHPVS
jgi:tryptophanyl-tRNA synthetase